MGYPTQQQKVDYLFKKIGFTKTKTGVAEDQTSGFSGDTKKAPPNEAIASPLIIPGSSVWSDSSFIPATPPASDTAYVGVYTTATAYRMTVDTTVANERTFIARQTWGNPSSAIQGDWIDTQFGADYLIKVFKNDPSVGVSGVDYFDLSAAGTTGKDDVWFFDYSSGVLNFNGEDLDGQLTGITTSNIYIVGYRYTGRKGIQPAAGIGTFHDLIVSNNLDVAGIATLGSGGSGEAILQYQGSTKIQTQSWGVQLNGTLQVSDGDGIFTKTNSSSTSNTLRFRTTAGDRLTIQHLNDESYITGVVGDININTPGTVAISTHLSVSGVSTFTGNIDANGIIEATAGQNKIPSLYQNFSDLPNAGTYHGMFAHVHEHGRGYFAHGGAWYELVNKESNGVVGTGTEKYNLGFTDTVNLKATGITTLGSIGISTGIISGPSVTYIDPAAVGDNTGTVVIKGDLQVDGTQTIVNSSTMTVTDKNIEMAVGAANDAAADGGGITVKSGDGDKTWRWLNGTDSWTSSEHIRIPDGKVFGFASDTNTYIHRPAADVIAFTTNAEERLRINNVGDVGIGSDSTGGARLRVYDNGTGTLLQQWRTYLGSTAGERPLNLYSPATDTNSDYFRFQTGNSIKFQIDTIDALCIDDGGKVGIGTDDPQKKLEVYDGDIYLNSTDKKIFLSSDYDQFITANASSNYFVVGTGNTERFRIDSSGRVGIGTDNPTAGLDVNISGTTNGDVIFLATAAGSDKFRIKGNGVVNSSSNFCIGDVGANSVNTLGGVNFEIFDSNPRFSLTHYDTGNSSIDGSHTIIGSSDGLAFDSTKGSNSLGGYFFRGKTTGSNPVYLKLSPDGAVISGITTLGNVSINNDLDVDGHTELDDLNVSGVSTFTGTSTFNGVIDAVGNIQIRNSAPILKFTETDNSKDFFIVGDSNKLSIRKNTTGGGNVVQEWMDNSVLFRENVDINADIDVDGQTNLDDVAIAGISTLSKEVGIGSALSVVGVSTFNDDVTITKDKDLIFDRFGTAKTLIRYNDTLVLTQIKNVSEGLEIGYRPAHLMWLTNRVLSTKLGGIHVHGDLETDSVSTVNLNSTGISTFAGKVSVGGTTGTDGYYLKSTGIGVTWAAFPNSRTGLTTSATAGQTTFNFSYNVGYVDVFLNGVKLPTSEFVASNGSTIVLDDAAFANDTLEFVSYNTVPNSSAGAQNLDGLADVTITGTPVIGETLQHNGSVFVNDYTPTATLTSTTQVVILSLPIATYRSAEYTIQVTEGTKYHVTKILAIHDGTNVTFNEYGTLTTSTSLSTFALDVNSGNMRLLVTPASTNSTVFKVKFTAIKV